MKAVCSSIWLDTWRNARASLDDIITDEIDDIVWEDLRTHVENIVVEQYRDHVYYEVKFLREKT